MNAEDPASKYLIGSLEHPLITFGMQSAAEIMECHATSGGRDYLLKIRVGDMAEYEAFLMGRLLAHHSVASANSGFALRDVKYTTALPL